jgi:EAL domain-containing protein (putative c-di-GMP-specific phosphodiesterase class I)/CheY-like chemotaxis protein
MIASNLNLLVVEDDDFQRHMVLKMLRSLGASSVSAAGNGKHALQVIRNQADHPMNVALCDLNMPEMDGMEFLRHLSQEQHNISIIITSALDSKLLASVARMARMYGIKLLGVIQKPITPAKIQELLSKYEFTENKWHQPVATENYPLEEILHGIMTRQFEPFLQPQVDMNTGRVVGAEALARWIHPEHGTVGPYAFIPALEQNGHIDELTFLMLERSAAACRKLNEQCHPVTISVNLSLISLEDPQLAKKITEIVRKAGIDPSQIVLEITETIAMTDGAHALENLVRLCMNGFSLSIDDYGTGYSNLQQLTRVAFSELKIDQSFVTNCADNEGLRIVVESSIDMARKLRVKSVAEGVETRQDWDMMRSMGCNTAQGYYIAKPMDLSSFGAFCMDYKIPER